jgi:hypothetical protein
MSKQLAKLGALPAHLAGNRLNVNAAARANMLASFAVLKIRGKQWRVRYRGDEKLITKSAGTGHDGRPLPEAPVQYVDVVIVAAASAISKKWYAGGYVDGVSQAPDCFSINGISPDAASRDKQNEFCATCPQNIWGSATTERGRKAKACRDGRRLAVVPIEDVDNTAYGGAMLLDIPPTSLSSLEMYTRDLERVIQADASQVVTRIGFNPDVTHQELTFETVSYVNDPDDYATVIEHAKGSVVARMLEAPVEETTADTTEPGQKLLGVRPAHLNQLRAGPTEGLRDEEPSKVAAPTPATSEATTASAQAGQQERRPAPASVARAAQAEPTKTPAAPTVVQGAPPSLEAEIDNLLNG